MFAAKGFENRSRVHINRGHDCLFHRKDSSQRLPTLIDLFDGRHVRHGATCCHVRENHRLLRATQNVGCLGHEVNAAKDDVGPL